MECPELEEVDGAVAAIQRRQEISLLGLPNVVGVGVGRKSTAGQDTGEPCLSVFVSKKLPKHELGEGARVPPAVERCKTDVVEVGRISADSVSAPPESRRGESRENAASRRVRPVRGGSSIGRLGGMTGTVATAVLDADSCPGVPTRYYLLGNNLALAGLNDGERGDPILQPGAADGGRYPEDAIAQLSRFVPLRFDGGANYVDAAVAEAHFWNVDRAIHWIGHVSERAPRVRIGQHVQKTGRATFHSTGVVRAVNVTLDVDYGARVARFCKQIVVSPCADHGDGGSLALDSARRAVGMVLATSEQATVISPIALVELLLRVRVCW